MSIRQTIKPAFVGILTTFLIACGSNLSNDTLYPYAYRGTEIEIATVMIAPINYGNPSRYYVRDKDPAVDRVTREYLEDRGVRVISNRPFESVWKKMPARYGVLIDPATGTNTAAFKDAINDTLSQLFSNNPRLDAVLFTDLIVKKTYYAERNGRLAEWDGIRRKVKVQGVAEDISGGFNWRQPIDAISIESHLIGRDLQVILHSVGGIQVADAFESVNGAGSFKRRNDLLTNTTEIREGIGLSLHPLFMFKGYPAAPTNATAQ
ncbi:Uncharacterised protein [BD1-7 clade bacterium]|uniref:Uncharacterized protein n=1 Tax=BD1-7 clade bacterium TaxID=2029982 RepID=A0A5S9QMZ8_9GAMM|nr:Uncharacterised protein [BD1-7 clade bacterium]